MSDGPATTPADGAERPQRRRAIPKPPNYAARRMLVGTGIVTLLFAAAVVGWRWFGGGDSTNDRDRVGWSTIAVVDRTTGDVTYLDADGEVVGESLDHGRTGAIHAYDGTVSLTNSRTLTVVPPPGSDAEPLVVELPDRAQVTPVRTGDGTFLATGEPTGGDVSLVDVSAATVVDIGDLAIANSPVDPTMFVATMRWNDDGSLFAIADAANFQTIVVRPGDPEPIFLADQPIAVGDDLIATSQTVGLQADVSLMGLDRTAQATVPTEIPAGSIGVLRDDRLTMVAVDGGVYRIESGADAAERIGAVAVPAGAAIEWVAPIAGGDRLVVGGATFEVVVDLDGRTLFTTTFATAVDPTPPDPLWTCLPVGGSDGYHSIVDVESGEQLADLSGVEAIEGVAADGCSVLASIAGEAVVIGPEGTATIGAYDRAVLGPDGVSVVLVTEDGTVELLVVDVVDDELVVGDPVDLSSLSEPDDLIAFVPD
ncbi:MAG: hypothetical protein CL424_16245 [Acidimicrobiaceae bacterium]|nr:hypothetical protein [Acidimicrobiaceae bacterium]